MAKKANSEEIRKTGIYVNCDCGAKIETDLNGFGMHIVGVVQFICPDCRKISAVNSGLLTPEAIAKNDAMELAQLKKEGRIKKKAVPKKKKASK